jgi:hypothetical protein
MPTPTDGPRRHATAKVDPRKGRTGQAEESPGRVVFFLATIALLVVGGWYLVNSLADNSKLEDCTMSGRKNCVAPIDTSNLGR